MQQSALVERGELIDLIATLASAAGLEAASVKKPAEADKTKA